MIAVHLGIYPAAPSGAMKRYVICALAAIALALNAQAEPKDKDKALAADSRVKQKPATAILARR
jgi:hypothetical protein